MFFCAGRRFCGKGALVLDHDLSEDHMDPRDCGRAQKEPEDEKWVRAWRPINVDYESWRSMATSPLAAEVMLKGARVRGPETK